ncbi:hypothetical protein [Streptomyces sp. LN785]|uniref:hypothetical protein n=1 Tax=Streptomyces sp. LN785 TaxID=3112983 RepID=UPI003718BFE0
MTNRIGWAISALGVLACLVLVTGAVQAYLTGDEPGWLIAFAVLLQVTTAWQLVRDVQRRRRRRSEEG